MSGNWAKRLLPAACAAGAVSIIAAALWWYPPLWQANYAVQPAGPFAQLGEQDLVNLNTADAVQLCLLPQIGEAKARAIIAYREVHGPFSSLDELLGVQGIGPAIAAGLEGLVCF